MKVPPVHPTPEIIQATEPALRKLDKTTADDIRIKIDQAIRNAKPPQPNLSRSEQAAIRDLSSDKSNHILPADKGNATVIMDRTTYSKKVQDILNSGSYRPLRKDPPP